MDQKPYYTISTALGTKDGTTRQYPHTCSSCKRRIHKDNTTGMCTDCFVERLHLARKLSESCS